MIPAAPRRTKIRPPRKNTFSQASVEKTGFDYEASWKILAHAIVQIQNKNVSTLSYEQLYRIAYTMILQKCGERLYEDVGKMVSDHLHSRRNSLLSMQTSVDYSRAGFLKALAAEWSAHLQSMKFISDVLMYMNRVYVKDQHKLLIYDLGVVLFESDFLRHNNSEMARMAVRSVCDEMADGRTRPISSRSAISSILAMFELVSDEKYRLTLNLYTDEFEQTLLDSCRSYYSDYAASALAERSGTLYLRLISDLIAQEESRLNAFTTTSFTTHTRPKVLDVLNETLIRNPLEKVMQFPSEMQGLSFWLEPVLRRTLALQSLSDDDASEWGVFPELQSLYVLEGRIDPERQRLKTHLRNVIVSQGLQLPVEITRTLSQRARFQEAGPKKTAAPGPTLFALEWIEAILQYQKCLGVLVQSAFNSDPSVEFTVFASLKQFINNGSAQPGTGTWAKKKESPLNAAELLSVYMDFHIKQLSKNRLEQTSTDLEFLNKSICFLKLIEDKQAFETHYSAHFARRFLNTKSSGDSSTSSDLEDVVISKLWDEVFMGSHHLERLIKMRKDVKSSAELTAEWKQHAGEDRDGPELDLKICSLAEWPKSMTKDHQAFGTVDGEVGFIWPKQLRPTMKMFEEFWLTGKKNDNKALYWYPKFGSMDLRITYPSRTYDINMSTYAGIIMLLFAPQSSENGEAVSAFEHKIVLTYTEIYELTKIPEADLKRQLRSIAVAPRSRLLVKSPMSRDVSSSDTFSLNSKFKAPTSRVKVLTVKSDAEKPEEVEEVQTNIHEGKQHLINASIVRVMKSRRTMNHNDLIQEIIKQLQSRFLPSMIHIKQRIEELIEKEYLRRDHDSPSVYHYIA